MVMNVVVQDIAPTIKLATSVSGRPSALLSLYGQLILRHLRHFPPIGRAI